MALQGLLDGDRLGKVPGAVNVAAPEDCQVVGQQLHRDDGQDGLEGVDSVRNLNRLKKDYLESIIKPDLRKIKSYTNPP